MIAGTDIVIPCNGDAECLDASARMILEHWPEAIFENAATGEVFAHYKDVPFGLVRELFVYSNAAAASFDAPIYLILGDGNLTVVVDELDDEFTAIIDSIRSHSAVGGSKQGAF